MFNWFVWRKVFKEHEDYTREVYANEKFVIHNVKNYKELSIWANIFIEWRDRTKPDKNNVLRNVYIDCGKNFVFV